MLRVALVGTGDAGKQHARALASVASEGLVAWTAICSRDAARLAAFRTEQAVPKDVAGFASLEAVIDARVCDAVILATPDGIHAEQGLARSRDRRMARHG